MSILYSPSPPVRSDHLSPPVNSDLSTRARLHTGGPCNARLHTGKSLAVQPSTRGAVGPPGLARPKDVWAGGAKHESREALSNKWLLVPMLITVMASLKSEGFEKRCFEGGGVVGRLFCFLSVSLCSSQVLSLGSTRANTQWVRAGSPWPTLHSACCPSPPVHPPAPTQRLDPLPRRDRPPPTHTALPLPPRGKRVVREGDEGAEKEGRGW